MRKEGRLPGSGETLIDLSTTPPAHQCETWRTIQTWWYYYRENGITDSPTRADKDTLRKVTPEDILAAIEKALPSFRSGGSGKNAKRPLNIQALFRACIEQGYLRRYQIAPNTFRRAVKKYELLKPDTADLPMRRLAFAKSPRQRPLAMRHPSRSIPPLPPTQQICPSLPHRLH